jgi:hypothetical protein
MDFRDMTYSEAETAYLALLTENENLKAHVAALEAKLGIKEPSPEAPLKHFATLEELEAAGESAWEKWPDEPATWRRPEFRQIAMTMQAGGFNERYRAAGHHLPYRNVIVDELAAEVRRMGGTGWDAERKRGGNANEDITNLANLRLLNSINPIWMALVQQDDDNWEGDKKDQLEFVAWYAGRVKEGKAGLRHSTKRWELYSQFSDHLKVFRDVYGGDYDPGNPKRPIPVTPAQ